MPTPYRPHAPAAKRQARRVGIAVAGAILAAAGCSSPLSVQSERQLRQSVIDSAKRELAEARDMPGIRATQREPGVERLNLKPELMAEYARMAGPQSYDPNSFPMDNNLYGEPQKRVSLTLEKAIHSTVQNNLQIEFARLQPAIAETQVVAAQAAFDFVFFSNLDWSNLDEPRAQIVQGGLPSGATSDQRITTVSSTGLRRPLNSGGQVTFQQDLTYTDINTDVVSQKPNPTNEVDWTLRLDQPLLRNFGTDVNMAQVRLNRNAERDSIASLKANLIKSVLQTENDYWALVQARHDLLILERLYERGVTTRDEIVNRFDTVHDVSFAEVADARARVERRSSDVLRAQQAFRAASDKLKADINDPEILTGAEDLIVPVDDTPDAPISFSLVDVMLTSIRNRPELAQAILSIDNTSIRMTVADNARLPRLDLKLQTRLSGLQDDVGGAYNDVFGRDFVDYVAGFQFEQPLGNRAAEENYRKSRLERMQATIAYRSTLQQVILQAKQALRSVVTNYQLIEKTRVTRVAESENLRAFEVEKQIIRGSTLVELDQEFDRQEQLANAEQQEIGALVDYNTALAQLFAAMGTSLEHNNIQFKVPNADDPLEQGGLNAPSSPVVPIDRPTPTLEPDQPKHLWPWQREKQK
jgi:outer membrane protein TolC